MEKLRLTKGATEKDLEPFGFANGVYTRKISGKILYRIVITYNHKNLQIEIVQPGLISGSLQCLIYKLIKAHLVELVEIKEEN